MADVKERCKVALVGNAAPDLPAWVGEQLSAAGARFVYEECKTAEALGRIAGDAEVLWIYGGPAILGDPANLHLLKKCTVILRSGTGTDNVAVEEATKLGILVGNTPVAAAPTVADHAVGLLLAVARRIPIHDRAIRRGLYDAHYSFPDVHLAGSTLGLVGFGRIAQLVARRMAAFDVKAIAADPYADRQAAAWLGVELVEIDDLCRRADFISVHCPLLPQTHHLIDERRIGLMKPKAIIVNTARGPIIDEAALTRALLERRIGGAGLDVFEVEPLPAGSLLRGFENVVLTPHTAGYSDTLYDDFWRHSVETILEVVRGRPPKWVVNKPLRSRLGERPA